MQPRVALRACGWGSLLMQGYTQGQPGWKGCVWPYHVRLNEALELLLSGRRRHPLHRHNLHVHLFEHSNKGMCARRECEYEASHSVAVSRWVQL